MTTYIQVYGRFRPSALNERDAIDLLDTNRVRLQQPGKEPKIFELHRLFGKTSTQQEVFEVVAKKLVNDAAEGVNATIFAYGQTGSGKTHTMLGPGDGWSDSDTKGLIPRSIGYLFENLELKSKESPQFKYTVSLEFVELYNETIFDLLDVNQKKISLRDTGSDIQLVGAISEQVDNYLDLMHVIKRGWIARRTGETAMNRDSSRSHALIIVKVLTEELMGTMMITRKSTLNLVDLAGSERQTHTKAAGERLKEATHINGSLSVLGRCIRVLSNPSTTNMFVPYRESPLTHILKNSLGGNSKTAVIVNMHPDQKFLAETASTLQFASACAMIKNTVSKNEHMTGESEAAYKEVIRQLRSELETVEERVEQGFSAKLSACEKEKKELNEQNMSYRAELTDLRAKYRCLLFQQNSDITETLPPEVLDRLFVDPSISIENLKFEQFKEKEHTWKLELDAKTREIDALRAELVEQRANMTLDETRVLRTPQSNRRRTRDPRRETIYKPSPARRAVFTEENCSDIPTNHSTPQQEQSEYLVLLQNYDECQLTISKMGEEIVTQKREYTSTLEKSEKERYSLKEQLDKANSESSVLSEKLERTLKDYKTLVSRSEQKDNEFAKVRKEMQDNVNRLNAELNDMREYYTSENTDIKNENEILTEENKVLQCVKYENELLKAELEKVRKEENEAIVKKLKDDLENANKQIEKLYNEIQMCRDETTETEKLKYRFDDAMREMSILKKTNEDLVKLSASRIEEHNKELKELSEKKQKQIEDVKNKLLLEKQAHDKTRTENHLKISSLDESYDQKKEKLRNEFDVRLGEELVEKEREMSAIYKRELDEKENIWKEEKANLEQLIQSLQMMNKEDSSVMTNLMGHANRDQKIAYVTKLRTKIVELETDRASLRQQLAKFSEVKRTLRPRN